MARSFHQRKAGALHCVLITDECRERCRDGEEIGPNRTVYSLYCLPASQSLLITACVAIAALCIAAYRTA